MSQPWICALAGTFLVSLVSITGVLFFIFRPGMLRRYAYVLVSLAVGALLGNVFFHLLPVSYERLHGGHSVAFLVTGGILLFFLLEKYLHWHHRPEKEREGHHPSHYGYLSLAADGLHNFTDGILIAAGWMAGPETGLATTLAVLLHEIPQEISDFGILVHAGFTEKRALWLNFLVSLTALLGTGITLLAGSLVQGLQDYILPFAAGGFLYLAGTGLMPELNRDLSRRRSLVQFAVIAAGLLLMLLVSAGHGHNH